VIINNNKKGKLHVQELRYCR